MQQMLRMFPDMRVKTPYPIHGDVHRRWSSPMERHSPYGKEDVEPAQTAKWDGDRIIVISAFWDGAALAQQIGIAAR